MTDAEELDHCRGAIRAWQQCVSHAQALHPEDFDSFDELMPPFMKRIMARIGDLTGMP